MKKIHKNNLVILLCFSALIALQTGAAGSNNNTKEILEGIKARYGNLAGFEVSYSREIVTSSMRMLGDDLRGDLATGTIYFKTPYSLRLDQKTPRPEILIANEHEVCWYIPDKKLVYLLPAEKFGKELRLLSDIFRGLTQAEERFELTFQCQEGEKRQRIELRPDPPWQEIEKIVLTVADDYKITEAEIHNTIGNITYFKLWDMIAKIEGFEDRHFQFVVPKGVEVKRQID